MNRPVGVTFVGLLVVLSGVVYVFTGIIGLFNADIRASFGLIAIITLLVIGLIYLGVASGLFNGNSFSRFIVAFFTFMSMILGMYQLIFVTDARWTGLWSVVFSTIILSLLFSRKATVFFSAR